MKITLVASAFVVALGWTCNGSRLTGDDRAVALSITFPSPVRVGDTVPITLRLTNTARDAVQFVGSADLTDFDVIVTRPDGTEVWSRLHGQVLLPVAHTRVLAPGETIELTTAWDLRDNAGVRVAPGEYRIQGLAGGSELRDVDTDPNLRTETELLTISP